MVSTSDLTDSNWHQLALTWNNDSCILTLFVDGHESGMMHTEEMCGQQLLPPTEVRIGNSENSGMMQST